MPHLIGPPRPAAQPERRRQAQAAHRIAVTVGCVDEAPGTVSFRPAQDWPRRRRHRFQRSAPRPLGHACRTARWNRGPCVAGRRSSPAVVDQRGCVGLGRAEADGAMLNTMLVRATKRRGASSTPGPSSGPSPTSASRSRWNKTVVSRSTRRTCAPCAAHGGGSPTAGRRS